MSLAICNICEGFIDTNEEDFAPYGGYDIICNKCYNELPDGCGITQDELDRNNAEQSNEK